LVVNAVKACLNKIHGLSIGSQTSRQPSMAGIAPITSDLQDAVTLALTFDKAAATAVAANASDDDQALQRKLWLAIARHLITATDNGADNDPVSIPDLLASLPTPSVCAKPCTAWQLRLDYMMCQE